MNQTQKQAKKAIESILTHKPDVTMREHGDMKIGQCARQGDIYIHKVAAKTPHGRPWGSRQVALGQQVGARHIAFGDGVEVFASDPKTAEKLLPNFTQEQRQACLGPVVVADGPWTLEHPEHAPHSFPAGTYVCSYQFDVQTMTRVND